VVRPATGEIVAMANLPTFDPNNLGASTPDARRNRIISDIAEPGSTFKIVVVSAALNENISKLTDLIDCEHGNFQYAGYTLHDAHEDKYNILSVEEVVAKSSNVGAAKIGIKLGPEKLEEYVRRFGFGEPTGIILPAKFAALFVPCPLEQDSITRIPMGHEVAATPLQMCLAMSAIANRGVLMRPRLVDHLEDAEGKVIARYPPQVARRVVSETAAQQMVAALKTVVSTNGSGLNAQLDFYTAAGKTGTAQKSVGGKYVSGNSFRHSSGSFPLTIRSFAFQWHLMSRA